MKLQILGGGNNQINGIRRAKEKGHEVILVDYYDNPPGREFADVHKAISTFDVEKNIEVAKKYQIDGVMTTGTDQPVFTVSMISKALNLPAFLDSDTAKAVTNKEVMKKKLAKKGIPTVPYIFCHEKISLQELTSKLKELDFPLVLKPLDSQGQRGVYKLHSIEEVFNSLPQTLSFSREKIALIEGYYESDEITVSVWVNQGEAGILTVTDRKTFESGKNIGICYAHQYPSIHQQRIAEITGIIDQIVKGFEIFSGPLYVQLLIGNAGIVVNEIACRIGGAYEEVFIPYLTGFDILDQVIDFSLGISQLSEAKGIYHSSKHLSVQLFFTRPGKIKKITPIEDLLKLPGVISAGYNVKVGQTLAQIDNATARAGYFIVSEESEDALDSAVCNVFDHLIINSETGENLVIRPVEYGE
ncbi:ATP-grasp domain-containing protein [Eubacteriaceae bacterium ES3]|nr:ATP-grasp domain-containing protein [Eubacteriaceae bacterium ES3]